MMQLYATYTRKALEKILVGAGLSGSPGRVCVLFLRALLLWVQRPGQQHWLAFLSTFFLTPNSLQPTAAPFWETTSQGFVTKAAHKEAIQMPAGPAGEAQLPSLPILLSYTVFLPFSANATSAL